MVIVNEATRAALIADGWTPPAGNAPPVPLCLDGYSPDMRCEAPAGHVIVPADANTWHRKGAVRWCGWNMGEGLT